MKWIFGAIALLALGLWLQLSLLVYAMYVLLGVLLINRFFTRAWVGAIDARRFGDCVAGAAADTSLRENERIESKSFGTLV